MDYKETLLMPKTKFPMRGNLPNKEPSTKRRMGRRIKYMKKYKKERKEDHYLCFMMDRHMQTGIFILVTH